MRRPSTLASARYRERFRICRPMQYYVSAASRLYSFFTAGVFQFLVQGLLAAILCAGSLTAQQPGELKPELDYLVYVLSEGADKIALVRFGPKGARVEREVPTGDMPTDIDGPHGLAISPDKQFFYVSLAHGRPFGSVWKYSTADDRVVGRVRLGLLPGNDGCHCGREFALRS